jgi:hypothetical protein
MLLSMTTPSAKHALHTAIWAIPTFIYPLVLIGVKRMAPGGMPAKWRSLVDSAPAHWRISSTSYLTQAWTTLIALPVFRPGYPTGLLVR